MAIGNKFIYLLIAFPLAVMGQEPSPHSPPLGIHSTPDFEITGDGADKAWNNTEWISLKARKGSSTYPTKVKILYSEKGIYSLFSCEDSKITSTLKEDFANLFHEDVVEIFLWPDQSVPLYFEYELSPYGYELAILVPNIKGKIAGWRPWHYDGERVTRHQSKIQKNEKGVSSWTAEVFIPYLLLRPLIMTPPQKGNRWRVNMYRIDYDVDETQWSWQPTNKNFHDFENFGTIEFQ